MSSTSGNRISKLSAEMISTEIEVIKKRRARILCPQSEKSQKNSPPLDVGNPENDSVGLALSGGGIRSAIFNLGLLQALHEKGRIDWVDYLSTVSGGGYIGACFLWIKNSNPKYHTTFPFPRFSKESSMTTNDVAWLQSHGAYLTPGSGLKTWAFAAAILRGTFINLYIVLPSLLLLMFIFSLPAAWSTVQAYKNFPLLSNVMSLKQSYFLIPFIIAFILAWLCDYKIKNAVRIKPIVMSSDRIEFLVWALVGLVSSIGIWHLGDHLVTFTKDRPIALISFLIGCTLLIRLGVNYLAYAYYSDHRTLKLKYDLHRFFSEQYGKLLIWGVLGVCLGCLPILYENIVLEYTLGTLLSGLGSFGVARWIQGNKDAVGEHIDETRGKLSLLINAGGMIVIGFILLSLYHFTFNLIQFCSSTNSAYCGLSKIFFLVTVALMLLLLSSSIWLGKKSNINRVSMWRYYRNRLMEAFFPSSGFLGSEDFKNSDHLIEKLRGPSNDEKWEYLRNKLKWGKDQTVRDFIKKRQEKGNENEEDRKDFDKNTLKEMFNGIIQGPLLYDEGCFSNGITPKALKTLDDEIKTEKNSDLANLLEESLDRLSKILSLKNSLKDLSKKEVILLNRLLLDHAFSEEIVQYKWNSEKFYLHSIDVSKIPTPYPIFNTAVVLKDSKNEKLRLRGCDSFIFTPKYIGSDATSYFEANSIEPKVPVPDAVAISGAAIDPNTGETKSWVLSVLMGLFNLRLGYWMKNPKFLNNFKSNRHSDSSPGSWTKLVWSEMRGVNLNEDEESIRLSDGAHFDSLGLYELIRRQCQFIIVSDATWDPKYHFRHLGRVIEKVRIDFGAEIQIDTSALTPTQQSNAQTTLGQKGKTEFSPRSWDIGKVTYKDKSVGTILFIKTSMISDLPEDVLSYKRKHSKFPDEPTTDQFFDEEQFEAYRELGYCCGSKSLTDLLSMETFDDSQNWFRQCLSDTEKQRNRPYLRTEVFLEKVDIIKFGFHF